MNVSWPNRISQHIISPFWLVGAICRGGGGLLHHRFPPVSPRVRAPTWVPPGSNHRWHHWSPRSPAYCLMRCLPAGPCSNVRLAFVMCNTEWFHFPPSSTLPSPHPLRANCQVHAIGFRVATVGLGATPIDHPSPWDPTPQRLKNCVGLRARSVLLPSPLLAQCNYPVRHPIFLLLQKQLDDYIKRITPSDQNFALWV